MSVPHARTPCVAINNRSTETGIRSHILDGATGSPLRIGYIKQVPAFPKENISTSGCQQKRKQGKVSEEKSPSSRKKTSNKCYFGQEIATGNAHGRPSSSRPATPRLQSSASANTVLYRRICLSKSCKTSKCSMFPAQFRSKIKKAAAPDFKRLPTCQQCYRQLYTPLPP